jgi:hypothetical protein
MRRVTRWYWAAFWSLLAFYGTGVLTALLFTGSPLYGTDAPLEDFTEWVYGAARAQLGDGPALMLTVLLLATPPMLVGILTFALFRYRHEWNDGHLHCLKCGYILKGLSEPRCPECGERI